MFPTIIDNAENEIQSTREKVISTSSDLGKTPNIEFVNKKITVENGTPKLITDIDAIRQWITLFVTTPKNTYKIYDGTNFGTSIRKLFGRKILNNGYEEAEVERNHRHDAPERKWRHRHEEDDREKRRRKPARRQHETQKEMAAIHEARHHLSGNDAHRR